MHFARCAHFTKPNNQQWCAHALAFAVVLSLVAFATTSAQAQKFTVLYSFKGSPDGSRPVATLIKAKGNLYGTTFLGGVSGHGTVFELNSKGKETVLYSFKGGLDGANPSASLIRDPKGNLYGTVQNGGISNGNCPASGCGTVFRLTKTGKETVLYRFKGGLGDGVDGANPNAGLVMDEKGNLYGTTYNGGVCLQWGTVFELDPSGVETVLHNFCGNGAGGTNPEAALVRDAEGNFYGTASSGDGISTAGSVFEVSKSGAFTALYSFWVHNKEWNDGIVPTAPVVRDEKGNLFGTTLYGGGYNCAAGCGTLFEVNSSGETVLYTFAGTPDGALPQAGLVRDAQGNFYGSTSSGGASNAGTVFKMDNTGNETVLYSFTGGADGASPQAGLVMDAKGNLYGATSAGGTGNKGTIFKLTP